MRDDQPRREGHEATAVLGRNRFRVVGRQKNMAFQTGGGRCRRMRLGRRRVAYAAAVYEGGDRELKRVRRSMAGLALAAVGKVH